MAVPGGRFTESAVLSSSDGLSMNIAKDIEQSVEVAARRRRMADAAGGSGPSLFDKLQATKQEKDAEFQQQFSMLGAPPGLDDEEATFLNDAIEEQERVERIRNASDSREVAAYASAVREIVRTAPEIERVAFVESAFKAPPIADLPVVVVAKRKKRVSKRKVVEERQDVAKRPASLLAAKYASSDSDN